MPHFKAPEGVTSVSAAGEEYTVIDGHIEAPAEVLPLIANLGFTQVSDESLQALQESANQAILAEEARLKADADAKAKAEQEAAEAAKKAAEEAANQAAAPASETTTKASTKKA